MSGAYAALADGQLHGFEQLARMFAAQSRELAEITIDDLATEAVQRWNLEEATFWQRVKFHARLLRSRARCDSRKETVRPC